MKFKFWQRNKHDCNKTCDHTDMNIDDYLVYENAEGKTIYSYLHFDEEIYGNKQVKQVNVQVDQVIKIFPDEIEIDGLIIRPEKQIDFARWIHEILKIKKWKSLANNKYFLEFNFTEDLDSA